MSNKGAFTFILNKQLENIGGCLLFRSNINKRDIMKLNITNTFLKEMLISWSILIYYDKEPHHIETQILCNNSHIINNNDTIVFPQRINKNVCQRHL